MSIKIIDCNNPVVLLKSYEAKEKFVKKGKSSEKTVLPKECLYVWMVHLNTIFNDIPNQILLQDLKSFIGQSSNKDIIHSIAGLFDICLPDMDLDTIYNSIASKEAYTIIAFSSLINTSKNLKRRNKNIKGKMEKIELIKKFLCNKNSCKENTEEDVYYAGEGKRDDFKLIFNNEESSDDDNYDNQLNSSSDEDADVDFSVGYNEYMKSVYQRKLNHYKQESETIEEIGFENQIAGSISFKVRYVDIRRIVHVTMLGVLKEFRGRGLGKYLISLVLDEKIVGQYDAVVVHADYSACKFFKKFGFSDDAILNTQWHSLEPEYTNCSLLTYVSAYSNKVRNNSTLAEGLSTAEMEVDIKLWQNKVAEIHCFQLQVFQKMKMEIEYLKDTIKKQDKLMKILMKDMREITNEKVQLENTLKKNSNFSIKDTNEYEILSSKDNYSMQEIELRVKNHFNESLLMMGQNDFLQFVDFIRSENISLLLAEHENIKKHLFVFSSAMVNKSDISDRILYFCEPFSMKEETKLKILSEGFNKSHRKPGSHGMGFYFTSNPSTAVTFSCSKNVIVAEVILGNICKNIPNDQSLKASAPFGYDSILVSNFHMNQINNNAFKENDDNSCFYPQDFVIFKSAQALPLGIINFSIIEKH